MTAPMPREEMIDRAKRRVFAEGVQVWRVSEGVYVSPAKSEPGRAYLITVHEGEDVACNCAGAVKRGICKHQEAVRVVSTMTDPPRDDGSDHDAARRRRELLDAIYDARRKGVLVL